MTLTTGNGANTLNIPARVTTTAGYSEKTTKIQTLTNAQANLIEEVTWHLGGTASYTSTTTGLARHWYDYERGTDVYSGRPTIWTGKIGLMYPSDYGYATSDAICKSSYFLAFNSRNSSDTNSWYNQSTCGANDWLQYTGSTATSNGTATSQWTISSENNDDYNVFIIDDSGYTMGSYPNLASGFDYKVRPSFYLKSTVTITSGDGSYDNPYIFE